jgi:hypothetical protein
MVRTNWIYGALCYADISCADTDDFVTHVKRQLPQGPTTSPAELGVALRSIKWPLHLERNGKVGASDIKRCLIAKDVQKILAPLRTKSFPPVTDELQATAKRLRSEFRHMGLGAKTPPIYIVKSLPQPYDGMGWEALTIDREDCRKYRIPPGVYLNRGRLRPRISAIQMAHESIHFIIGQKRADLLARGLEEGLCEILGSVYLGAKLFGTDVARRVFIMNQLGGQITPFWDLYVEYTRQAAYLYRQFGLTGLLHLVRRGRAAIKSVEAKCLVGNLHAIKLPSGKWDSQLSKLLEIVTSTYVRCLVVSPLARYTAEFVETGSTVRDIARNSGLAEPRVIAALKELQAKTFCLVLSENRVDYSDVGLLLRTNSLRYSLAEQ